MQENCKLRWVASGAMLADCSTKTMDASRLREFLKNGRYSLFDEQMVLKEGSPRRKRVQWLKESEDTTSKAPDTVQKTAFEVSLYSGQEDVDYCRVDHNKGYLEHVQRKPRWKRFTPIGVPNCPVAFQEIGVDRTTIADLASGRKSVQKDIWVGEDAFRSEIEAWTGITRFKPEPKDSKGAVLP